MVDKISQKGEIIDIENVQDIVETTLFENKMFNTAKQYIMYRADKDRNRGKYEKYGIL